MTAAAPETLLRWLLARTKQSKGVVQMEMVSKAFALIPGWSIEETTTFLPLVSYDGNYILRAKLKAWMEQWGVGYINGGSGGTAIEFRNIDKDLDGARAAFVEAVELVTSSGKMPEVEPVRGCIYTTVPEETRRFDNLERCFQVRRAWLGVRGWTITTPNGTTTLASPVTSGGEPYDAERLEGFARFWTFCYKHGLANAAKAALDRQDPAAVEAITAPAAERKRQEERRIFLPEIENLLIEIVDQQFQTVCETWTKTYLGALDTFLTIHERAWLDAQGESYPRWESWRCFDKYVMLGFYQPFIDKATERDRSRKGEGWLRRRDNYKEVAQEFGKKIAENLRYAFVHKNTYKLSLIARTKGNFQAGRVTKVNMATDFGGEMLFTFTDGSKFTVRNKTVFKVSPLGRPYEQYPTTFHDVVMPDGSAMGTPSEKRMVEVFGRGQKGKRPR